MSVERSGPHLDAPLWNGYVWTVTFHSVRTPIATVDQHFGDGAGVAFEPSHLGTELRDDLEAMFWWQKRVAGNAHALSGPSMSTSQAS